MAGEEEDLWGDEGDEDLLVAMADQGVGKSEVEGASPDPFDDGEDDVLMQSLLDVTDVEEKVEAKEKADEVRIRSRPLCFVTLANSGQFRRAKPGPAHGRAE